MVQKVPSNRRRTCLVNPASASGNRLMTGTDGPAGVGQLVRKSPPMRHLI